MRAVTWAAAGLLGLAAARVEAQPSDLRMRVEQYVSATQKAIVAELVDLLSIPNVASDRPNIRRNAERLRSMLDRRGFAAELLDSDGNPLVYGRLDVPGARRTLLVYAHYDGQPVNPALWKQASAFVPVLRDDRLEDGGREVPGLAALERFEPSWRIYARSASDDKSPIVAFLTAIDALKASGIAPSSNLRVILDGEEEAGSPSLVPAIARYRDKLAADLMLLLDGPMHPSARPTLVFGARGLVTIRLTVYGPKVPLHSGHYGNWVPNPAMRLAALLASCKDERGRILIEGFYESIGEPTPDEEAMLAEVPDDPAGLQKLFGISAPENPELSLQAALQLPTFNVHGLSSMYVGGEARTVIPDRAEAAIDIRLVKETPAMRIVERVRAHLVRQGYHVVSGEPDDQTRARYSKIVKFTVEPGGSNAVRTSPLHPVARQLTDALTRTFGEAPVRIRTSGGWLPIAPFIEALGFPAVIMGIVNVDNNQHGENENLRLDAFFGGITTIAVALTM